MTDYELWKLKKEQIRKYWDDMLSEYENHLGSPKDSGGWNSISFRSILLKNHDHSLVMMSLYSNKIDVTIIDWRGNEEFKEERVIKDLPSYINTVHRINKSKEYFGVFLK